MTIYILQEEHHGDTMLRPEHGYFTDLDEANEAAVRVSYLTACHEISANNLRTVQAHEHAVSQAVEHNALVHARLRSEVRPVPKMPTTQSIPTFEAFITSRTHFDFRAVPVIVGTLPTMTHTISSASEKADEAR